MRLEAKPGEPETAYRCVEGHNVSDVRTLVRTMAEANPRWGAPRIHYASGKTFMATW